MGSGHCKPMGRSPGGGWCQLPVVNSGNNPMGLIQYIYIMISRIETSLPMLNRSSVS
nr:hypothetical protein Q903MT_gene5243 [Picea sitchensis]